MPRRVVITGLGVVTALGDSLDQFWSALCEGRSGVANLDLFDTTHFKVHFGGQVHGWDGDARFGVKEARRLDRFAQFAMAAAESAVADSGIDFSKYPPENCGVLIGSGIGGLNEFETQHETMLTKGPSRISPFTIPKLMVNAGSGQVSIRYGLKGINSAVATACASSNNAIGDAFKHIQLGHADVMITGGSEAAITRMGLGGFAAMRALSTRNDDPPRASRPFDRDRDGFVLAEGAGILILEAEEIALARGARIYAEMLGYGMSADGTHITAPDEEGRGASGPWNSAWPTPDARPTRSITSTCTGRAPAWATWPRPRRSSRSSALIAKKLQVSSTKSQLGHLLGASGGVELVACSLAIRDGVLPPTINLDNPDPECDLDYIPNVARQHRVNHVMSNSFGFGGHNASLLIGRYPGKAR